MIARLLAALGIPKWVALAVLCAAVVLAAFAYRAHLINHGVAVEAARRDELDAERVRVAGEALAAANGRVKEAQDQLAYRLADIKELKGKLSNAQTTNAALQSDLAAGRRRLSVLTTGASRPAQQADGAAVGGMDKEARVEAELDGAVAAGLVGLTDEGDSAIVRLEACIRAYDAVKSAADSL